MYQDSGLPQHQQIPTRLSVNLLRQISSVVMQVINAVYLKLRALSLYSLFDEFFDKVKLAPTRKKLTEFFFFIFSSDITKRSNCVKNRQNILELFLFSRHKLTSNFFLFPIHDISPNPLSRSVKQRI